MTAQEKLNEAKFFLDKIITEKENLKELRYNTSAFLSAIRSIPDHALEEANKKLGVGIQITQYLDEDKFRKKAEENGNQKALDFLNWRESEIIIHKQIPPNEILRYVTNRNLHRIDIPFKIIVYYSAKEPLTYEKPRPLDIEVTGGRNIDSISELMNELDISFKLLLERLNQNRAKHNDPPASELNFEIRINFPNIIGLQAPLACEAVYQIMEIFVNDFQKYKQDKWLP